jgi:type IV pilus biogenesis protein CpaD/CtpE
MKDRIVNLMVPIALLLSACAANSASAGPATNDDTQTTGPAGT